MNYRKSFTRTVMAVSALTLVGYFSNVLAAAPAEAQVRSAAAKKVVIKKLKAALKKKGIGGLPSVGKMAAKAKKKTSRAVAAGIGASAVSGTPPTLAEIANNEIANLFWQEGVVQAITDGNPNPSQCNQFWAGNQDGDSGGFGACHMAESVGYSFESILGSETSLCYMKRFPTAANVAAGAVDIVSGEFPDNNVTKLFSPPTGSESRVVKVSISGADEGQEGPQNEDVFIRVHSESENQAAKKAYSVDLWFCSGGEPSGYDSISIFNSGKFVAANVGMDGGEQSGAHSVSVEGYLTMNGSAISWDTTKTRESVLEFVGDSGFFKSHVDITPANLIKALSYDSFGGGFRKAFTVTSFSGTGADSLRFLTGAFKEEHGFGEGGSDTFSGATEYRGSYYAAAPQSSMLNKLNEVDLDNDPFFASEPTGDYDLSEFDCDITPDIEVSLDMSNPVLQEAVSVCENAAMRGMHFCHDNEAVRAADDNYRNACSEH